MDILRFDLIDKSNFKTAILNPGLFINILGPCLSFPSRYTTPKSTVYNSRYDTLQPTYYWSLVIKAIK
jgi:hypothetical protein